MTVVPLLNPRSIAIIGASDRPSTGRNILVSLERLGFPGAIYPINPARGEILGRTCYPSLAEVPGEIDVAAFCVGNSRLPQVYPAAIEKGVKAAVIYSGGFSESREVTGQELGAMITGSSREAGIALCGPNCMGTLSPSLRSTTYMHEVFDAPAVTGSVALVSQSGAVCIAMAADTRRFGFSHIISSGNEAVLTVCDYLDFLISDRSTRVIALFLESVREPERFVCQLDAAASAGKPVVVLKVGKSERARQSVLTHTGGLAGESKVFSAVLRAHRAVEVESLSEMTEVLSACQGRLWPRGEKIAVMTGSGGQAELILDAATANGFELPALDEMDRKEVERIVGPITGDGNPLDAWGSGDAQRNYPHSLRVLGDAPSYDAVALVCDGMDGHPLDDPMEDLVYAEIVASAASEGRKPFYLLSTRAGVFRTDQERIARSGGVAVISGINEGLGAIRQLARWHTAPGPVLTGFTAEPVLPNGRSTINEFDAKRLLAAAGVPITKEFLVNTIDQAGAARKAIDGPVALKVCSDQILHKSDFRLLELGIETEAELVRAWRRLESRCATMAGAPRIDGFLVQQFIEGGVEVFAGVKRDTDFGLIIAFGAGGTFVEIVADVVLRPLPLRQGDARAMIAESRLASRLLAGVRGNPPCDVESLTTALERIAQFAWANRDTLEGLDVNPIRVLPYGEGCVVLDAVIVARVGTNASAESRRE